MPSRVLLRITLKLVATLTFAGMLACAKAYSHYPLSQLVFLRSFVALLVLVLWLAAKGEFPQALITKRLAGHLLRSALGVISIYLNLAAFGLLPFADVTAINFATAPLIIIISALMGAEPMRGMRWAGVTGGICGVLLMLWEQFGVDSSPVRAAVVLGVTCAIGNAIVVAFALIQTRSLAKSEHTGAIVFYFMGLTALVAWLVMILSPIYPADFPVASFILAQSWIWPPAWDWLPLLMIGVFGGIGQILMTTGYRYADASVLACFDYSAMLWALLIGVLIFGESPSALVLFGSAIVIASGIAVIWHEGQFGLKLRAASRMRPKT